MKPQPTTLRFLYIEYNILNKPRLGFKSNKTTTD
jgi:hypothetical protein